MDAFNTPTEYADALPLLEQAMADLAKGQLVCDDRCTLMDLMSAIEINDVRTDTFLHAQKERQHQSSLPAFDPSLAPSARDVVWLHDEILRLEATFYSGYPLASTLWACNYFRVDSLVSISGLSPPNPATSRAEPESQLQTVVLRALVLGVLKCAQVVWEELSKNQVYEHEDVHLSRGSLSFNTLMSACYPPKMPPPRPPSSLLVPGQSQDEDPPQPPTERLISVDDVLRDLNSALMWLQAEERLEDTEWLDAAIRDALIARVTLRIDLLYLVALLAFPAYTSPSAITHHLDRIRSYAVLFPSEAEPRDTSSFSTTAFEPSPALRSAFHPSMSIPLLATQQPPRPVDILPLERAYDVIARTMMDDLGEIMALWSLWVSPVPSEAIIEHQQGRVRGGWRELREWSRMRARNTEVLPYVRSLQQSLISSPSHLFHVHPLSTVSTSFLSLLTDFQSSVSASSSLPPEVASPAVRAQHPLDSVLSEHLAPKLVQFSSSLAGQNRGRQRRWIIKSLGTWADLGREVEVATLEAAGHGAAGEQRAEKHRSGAGAAVSAVAHELALEALISGFEDSVGLFAPGLGGRGEAWWVAARLAGRLASLWENLLHARERDATGRSHQEGKMYLEAKCAEARAVQAVSAVCWLAAWPSSQPVKGAPKISSPFLPFLAISPEHAERGRFRQRFEWLDRLPPGPDGVPGDEGLVADWEAYRAERDKLAMAQAPGVQAQSAEACKRAVQALARLERNLPALRGATPTSRRRPQRLGPLSRVPLSAFGLSTTEPTSCELAVELERLMK